MNDEFFIDPLQNCVADYLLCEWNSTTNRSSSRKEVEVEVDDFGGAHGISYLDHGVFDQHLIPVYDVVIDEFKKNGYVFGTSIFGAPYDWRLNPIFIDDYWPKFQELIERAYEKVGVRRLYSLDTRLGAGQFKFFSLKKYLRSGKKNMLIDCFS